MQPWDEIHQRVELACAAGQTTAHWETELLPLIEAAMEDRSIDSELHAEDVARWLSGMVAAYLHVRTRHPNESATRELADLKLILTRWLHPARPR